MTSLVGVALYERVQSCDCVIECLCNCERTLVNCDPDVEDRCPGLAVRVQILKPLWRVHRHGYCSRRCPDTTRAIAAQAQEALEEGGSEVRQLVKIVAGEITDPVEFGGDIDRATRSGYLERCSVGCVTEPVVPKLGPIEPRELSFGVGHSTSVVGVGVKGVMLAMGGIIAVQSAGGPRGHDDAASCGVRIGDHAPCGHRGRLLVTRALPQTHHANREVLVNRVIRSNGVGQNTSRSGGGENPISRTEVYAVVSDLGTPVELECRAGIIDEGENVLVGCFGADVNESHEVRGGTESDVGPLGGLGLGIPRCDVNAFDLT